MLIKYMNFYMDNPVEDLMLYYMYYFMSKN